jgi:hypothetical protein
VLLLLVLPTIISRWYLSTNGGGEFNEVDEAEAEEKEIGELPEESERLSGTSTLTFVLFRLLTFLPPPPPAAVTLVLAPVNAPGCAVVVPVLVPVHKSVLPLRTLLPLLMLAMVLKVWLALA